MWRITYLDTRYGPDGEFVVLEVQYYSRMARTVALLSYIPYVKDVEVEKI